MRLGKMEGRKSEATDESVAAGGVLNGSLDTGEKRAFFLCT